MIRQQWISCQIVISFIFLKKWLTYLFLGLQISSLRDSVNHWRLFWPRRTGFKVQSPKTDVSLPSNKKFLISLILFFWLLAAGENEKFLEVRLHWAGEKTKLALLGWSPFSELSTLVSRKFPSFVKISPNDFTKKVNNQN